MARVQPDTLVSDIMSTDLPSVSPSDTIEHCMEIMTGQNIRYMPVFDNGELSGIISMSDVVKETILATAGNHSSIAELYLQADLHTIKSPAKPRKASCFFWSMVSGELCSAKSPDFAGFMSSPD